MRSVGVKALKDHLSEYVRLAAGGETVLVTDRDRVVAELVPPRVARAESVSDVVVAEGVRTGWITPRSHGPDSIPALPPGHRKLADVLRELADDRADR
jgi:antitoxin (DNA-binding transcriptional repressor) of toxin-antitoxin stability system